MHQIVLETLNNVFEMNKIQLSSPIIQLLSDYIDLLYEWNAKINLTAHSIEAFINEDLMDSLYFARRLQSLGLERSSILDMGCGDGHLGIISKLLYPTIEVGFLDSNRKKINFVRQACRDLKLPHNSFINNRAEVRNPLLAGHFNLVVSRATWPPIIFFEYAKYYVQNNGHIISLCSSKQGLELEQNIHNGFELVIDEEYIIHPTLHQRRLIVIKKIA